MWLKCKINHACLINLNLHPHTRILVSSVTSRARNREQPIHVHACRMWSCDLFPANCRLHFLGYACVVIHYVTSVTGRHLVFFRWVWNESMSIMYITKARKPIRYRSKIPYYITFWLNYVWTWCDFDILETSLWIWKIWHKKHLLSGIRNNLTQTGYFNNVIKK